MGSEEFNTDELEAPEWLNEEFFAKVLKADVKKLEIKPGSKKGDHYASVMYRVQVTTGEKDEKTFIVKIMPFIDGPKKDFLDVTLFKTEVKMYTKVIPRFEKELKEAGDNATIAGTCVYAALEPHPIIIFEDLTKQNYKPVSSWGGDWEISKKAIDKLSKWHAISYKSFCEGDNELQAFSSNFYTGPQMIDFPSFANAYPNFIEVLKEVPEFHQYVPKFEEIAANKPLHKIQSIYKSFFNGEKANLFVLNHSDFHIKNLMLLEDADGKVVDVKLIDFQLCIWAPAIIDLICALYMTLDTQSRLCRRDELISYYHGLFVETLNKLNFKGDIPKLTDIYEDFKNFKEFELYMCVTTLPFVLSFEEDNSKFTDEVFSDTNIHKKFYRNPKYVDYLRIALPDFLHRGYLD